MRKKFVKNIIVLFVLFYTSFGYAQEVLQLKKSLNQAQNDDKVKLYLQIADTFLNQHQLDSAKYYVNQAVTYAVTTGNAEWLSKIYYKSGDIQYYAGEYEQANHNYIQAQNISLKYHDTLTYVDLLIERGYIYMAWQKNDSTLLLMNQAINLSQKINYPKGLARASLVIGNIYHGLNQYQKALEFYQKTLKAAQKISNQKGIGIAYENIGMCYLDLHQDDAAIDNLKKSIAILHNVPNTYIQIGNAYDDLAIIYARKGNAKLSRQYYLKALNIFKTKGNKEDIAIGYNVIAECLSDLGRYAESNRYLDSAIAIAKNIKFGLMLQKSYLAYAENLKHLHRYDQAYTYLTKHNRVKDSLQSAQFHQQLAEMDVKYKSLEKQHHIAELEHKRKLDKAHFRILLISGISLILLLLIGAYIIVQKRQKQKEIAELELEKSRIHSQSLDQQLELKNRQLTSHALNMIQKNLLLTNLSDNITDIIHEAENNTKSKLKRLKKDVHHYLNSEKDWDTFKMYFEQINKDFTKKLKQINPDLTQNDIRLATLLKLNMTNKEISSILNITYQSVRNAQHRLKTKLGLDNHTELRDFINTL